MKTWIKRILIGLVVVVVAAVVGLAIFLLTFDPNAYKYKLAELVQARYHRTLNIGGPIELSLFPRIGLALQDVSLTEPDSTEKFASIESARVAVQVWPLLSNNLVVDNVAITGFKARVVRKKDGHFNFENLVGGPKVPEAPANTGDVALSALVDGKMPVAASPARAQFQIDIAGLDLKNGEILLQDNISNKAVALTQLNANTGRVTFNEAFNFNMSARVAGGDPRVDAAVTGQAMLTLDPSRRLYAAQKLDLRLNGQLPDAQAKSLAARGNLAYDGNTGSLNVSALEMIFQGDVTRAQSPMTNVEASLTVPKLAIDPHKDQLQVDRLAIRAKGSAKRGPFELALDTPSLNVSPTNASGDALTGRLRLGGQDGMDASFGFAGISGNASELDIKESKFNATTKEGARVVKMSLTSPLSLNLRQRTAAMSAMRGDFTITDPALPKGDLQIPVIGSLTTDLSKDVASAKINAVLEGGKFDLTADVAHLLQMPVVSFKLAVDTLDLDKLAPPLAALQGKPGAAPATGDAPATAPPAEAADDNLNFSALVGPSANGSMQIGHLIFRGLKADDVAANMKLENGKLDVNTLTASLYEGKLAGVLSLNAAQNNRFSTKLSLAGVSIEPLLADTLGSAGLAGKGSVIFDLSTVGANYYAMKNALNGTAQLRLRDGAVRGINVAQTLRDLKNAVKAGQLDASGRAIGGAVAAATSASSPAAQAAPAGASSGNPPAVAPAAPATPATPAAPVAPTAQAASPAPAAAAAATAPQPAAAASPAPAAAPATPKAAAPAQAAAAAPAGGAAAAGTTAATSGASVAAATPATGAAAATGPVTNFSSLDLDVKFSNGVGDVKTLNLTTPVLRITQGKAASFNLVSSTLDVQAQVRVVNPAAGPEGADLEELKNITVPLHVVGPFEKPIYSIQWSAVASDVAKKVLEKKLTEAASDGDSNHIQQIGDAVKGLLTK